MAPRPRRRQALRRDGSGPRGMVPRRSTFPRTSNRSPRSRSRRTCGSFSTTGRGAVKRRCATASPRTASAFSPTESMSSGRSFRATLAPSARRWGSARSAWWRFFSPVSSPPNVPSSSCGRQESFSRGRGLASSSSSPATDPRAEIARRLAKDLGLGSAVRFTGTVAHAKVPSLMHGSDLFVSTSSLTNVAIPTCEAMVCGLPVVGFDVGNTRDAIVGRRDGVRRSRRRTSRRSPARSRSSSTTKRSGAGWGNSPEIRAKKIFIGWDQRIEEEIRIIEELVRSRG